MVKKAGYLLISFLVFVFLLFIGSWFVKPSSYNDVQILNDGWEAYYNGKHFETVSLSEFRKMLGDGTHKGDTITLIHEDVDIEDYDVATIMFESRFSAWQLYQDDMHVESRYVKDYEKDAFIGCDYNFVTLDRSDEDIRLQFNLFISEDGAYNYFQAPVIGDYVDVLSYEVYHYSFFFLIAGFLIIFGLIFFIIAIAFRSDIPEINMQMYSALLFVVLGTWFLAQFELLDLFVDTKGHQTEIEYISLYMVVPLMYLAMGCMRNYLKKKVFWVFSIIGAIIPFVLIVLHYTGVVHINRLLFLYQIDAMVLIGFMFVMVLMIDARSNKVSSAQYIQLLGQIMLAVSFIFNVFFYYLEVMGVSEQLMVSKMAVPIGTMCMVFATLVNYYLFISESLSRKNEYNSLAHLAYADELTGLANRSKYEKYMDTLWESGDDYIVISIDLNGLKKVNDNQGHLMGDKYLLEFGEALEDTFANEGFIARIGGDEFVAILTGGTMGRVDELIAKLRAYLSELNAQDPSINRSAAVGFAYRHEGEERDYNSIYLLADERMYENKQLTHSARS